MISVFDLKQEYLRLNDLAFEFNEETGEIIDNSDIINSLLSELNETKEQKLENIEYLKRENNSKIDTLSDEIKRLQSRKKSLENTNNKLKELQVILLDNESLKTSKFTFSFRNSKEYNYDEVDLSKVPKEFLREKIELDKTLFKKFDKALEFGLKIEEKPSLSVR